MEEAKVNGEQMVMADQQGAELTELGIGDYPLGLLPWPTFAAGHGLL